MEVAGYFIIHHQKVYLLKMTPPYFPRARVKRLVLNALPQPVDVTAQSEGKSYLICFF
jgi:hypothetical protein